MRIVVLPGLDGTGTLAPQLTTILETKHSVTSLQYPTHLYCYADLKEWLEGFLPSDDYIIIAESFSGPLAVMIAAENPAHLKGVVFVATFARKPRPLPALLSYAVKILPIKSPLLVWMAQPLLMGKWSTNEFTTKFKHAIKHIPAATIAGRLKQVLTVNVVEKLRGLNIPTLYLKASHDRLVPAKVALDFGRVPESICTVEGPHFLLQANPVATARHIIDFAEQVK